MYQHPPDANRQPMQPYYPPPDYWQIPQGKPKHRIVDLFAQKWGVGDTCTNSPDVSTQYFPNAAFAASSQQTNTHQGA